MRRVTFFPTPTFHKKIIYAASNGPIIGAGGANSKYCLSHFSLRRRNSLASPHIQQRTPHTAVLAPARITPSATAVGSAAHFFTHGNPSAVVPLVYPSSSTAPTDTFAHLSAALPGRAFMSLSTTGLGLRQVGTSPKMYIS